MPRRYDRWGKPVRWVASLVLAIFSAGLGFVPRSEAFERHRYEKYPELEGLPVVQVLILGNNKTQEVILLREMRTTAGQPFRSEELWRDYERLADLGLFAQIEVDAVPSGEGVLAVVSVHERPSWFIAPILDYDLDTKEIAAGFQARVLNLHGMNRQLRLRAIGGSRESFSISWSTPWVGESKRSLAAEFRSDLPGSRTSDLTSTSFTLSSTQFLGNYKLVRQGITGSARLESLRRDADPFQEKVIQLAPTVGAGWFRDTRNVRVDPDRGVFLFSSAEVSQGWITEDLAFLRGQADLRSFTALGSRFVWANRGQSVLTTGRVPFYRNFALGGGSSIRGQEPGVVTGKNFARGSTELRIHLIGTHRVGFNLPLLPPKISRLSNFDFRIDGALFADAGTAWNYSQDLADAPVKWGAGFGLRVFLPFVELVRLELAFDEQGNPTFYIREGNFL